MTSRLHSAAFVLLSGAACGDGDPHGATPVASDVIPTVDLDATTERTEPAAAALRPQPAQRRGAWAVALNDACASCHVAAAAQWRSSRHHRSNDNHPYRQAFAREPSAFCTSCHAPEARDPRRPTAPESRLGVGCVSCHVLGDEGGYTVLSAKIDDVPPLAPHHVTRSLDFGRTGGCVGCHEFRFPGRSGDDPRVFMQTTIRELEHAAGTDVSCASCHMERGDHSFRDVRDPTWLARGLVIAVERLDADGVALALSLPEASHAFPTGDLFRRLEVGVEWRDGSGRAIDRRVVHLARHFESRPGGAFGRTLVADDRVHVGPRRVPFVREGSAEPSSSLRWWVTLQRVAEIGHGHDESDMIDSEELLHQGTLDVAAEVVGP